MPTSCTPLLEGLYWADVAATPDLAEAERVVLTEAHLIYALAWDERLFWRTPPRSVASCRRTPRSWHRLFPILSQSHPQPCFPLPSNRSPS